MPLETLSRWTGYADLALSARRVSTANSPELTTIARTHLAERMGRMHGLPQKLGQIMSMSDHEEKAQSFSPLQQSAAALPFSTVKTLLETAWGEPLRKVVRSIDEQGQAASLGQVHRATLYSGEEVAIKLQYPGIKTALETDLGALGWLSLPLGGLSRGFRLDEYQKMLAADLEHELDYDAEARTQQRYAEIHQHDRFLIVPEVIGELSSKNVLVTTWEAGSTIDEVAKWPLIVRRKLSLDLIHWFFTSILSREMIHADLHPGNVRFVLRESTPKLLLYDFGCVARFTQPQQQALAALLLAALYREGSPWKPLMELGFCGEKLGPLAHKLPAVMGLIAEPLASEYPFALAQWKLSERMSDVLGDDRWNFRMAGPAEMVLLLRAWHGLLFYLEKLDAPVAWKPIVEPIISSIARRYVPAAATTDEPRRCDFGSLSRWLKLRVRERGTVKVQLTMAARSIDDLEELIDEPLRKKIEAQGTSLARLSTEVRQRQYRPGSVFSLIEGEKEIDVWLE